jgi:hypothetical protein
MKYKIKYTTQRVEEHEEIVEAKNKEEAIDQFENDHDDADDNTEIYKIEDLPSLKVGKPTNWKKKAREYIETLQLEEGDYPKVFLTQKQARNWIKEWIEFIVATNGSDYWLWEIEKDLIREISQEIGEEFI